MKRDSDIASMVVSEQLNRMLEQERKTLVLPPLHDPEQVCPFVDKDQLSEIVLRMAVAMKISMTARFN